MGNSPTRGDVIVSPKRRPSRIVLLVIVLVFIQLVIAAVFFFRRNRNENAERVPAPHRRTDAIVVGGVARPAADVRGRHKQADANNTFVPGESLITRF
ncbi:hypothetical protein KOR42_54320 [Thalassoglobus neptunius]|uniref:Uncharacterized protein n=1 Tax=Thalassoglobus neptunius TaxID=1938619 RepID=A0A5C5UY25_9PLAN|nr:hypothetical protein [Thalassoglobus neptunius]TWT30550.1 hypothetical protein KOR42_54320 [Thalassoglobus neptunius]